jgi:membrane-associated phospholipid phosphatase
MSSYGIALLLCTKNHITVIPSDYRLRILGITFIFTFLLPTINALILLKLNRIKSLEMETARERIIPYIGAALYHYALFYLFYRAHFPPIFQMIILGSAISIFLTLLITFWWKISAHTVGVGGISGGLLGIIYLLQTDLIFIFMILILCSGIVGYARLKLNAHTPAQVYTGFALGFVVELALILFCS